MRSCRAMSPDDLEAMQQAVDAAAGLDLEKLDFPLPGSERPADGVRGTIAAGPVLLGSVQKLLPSWSNNHLAHLLQITRDTFRSASADDLPNHSQDDLQVQDSGLGGKSCGLSDAALVAASQLPSHELLITPTPAGVTRAAGLFRQPATFFTIQEPHTELMIEARSEVMVDEQARGLAGTVAGLGRGGAILTRRSQPGRPGRLSVRVRIAAHPPERGVRRYARSPFTPGRPFAEALLDLTARITRISGSIRRRPMCEPRPKRCFAQAARRLSGLRSFADRLLRSLNLAARYVSGYLRTYPPPGRPRLVGADASHAWVSAYCPGIGWLDVDPTNNVVPSESHVTLAWGRDYGDVSPVRGVILGGRDHKVEVGVDMEPVSPDIPTAE